MMNNDETPKQLALQDDELDRQVAGAPFYLHERLPGVPGNVEAVDIKAGWNDQHHLVGWLYKGSDGNSYWQANHAMDDGVSYSASYLVGNASYTNPSGAGPVVKVDADHPVPKGVVIFDEVDHRRHTQPHGVGLQLDGTPFTVGDVIPRAKGGRTTITDYNVIMDDNGNIVGYVYRGDDENNYFVRRSDTTAQTSYGVGVNVGRVGFSVSQGPQALTEPHLFRDGDIHPGEHLEQGPYRNRPTLDSDGPGIGGPAGRHDQEFRQTSGQKPSIPHPFTPELADSIAVCKEVNEAYAKEFGRTMPPTIAVERNGCTEDVSYLEKLTGTIVDMDDENIYHQSFSGKVIALDRIDVLSNVSDPEVMNHAFNLAYTSGQPITLSISDGQPSLEQATAREMAKELGHNRGLSR